jgi:prolyl-tRNA synthetase
MASDEEIKAAFGLEPGFLGPYQMPEGAVSKIIADQFLQEGTWVVGANEVDYHFTGVSLNKEIGVSEFTDLRMAQGGDACVQCGGTLKAFKGIEVGHVFYLGTKYSEAMKCNVLNDQTKEVPMVMGCYGIGVSRVMAATVEQYATETSMCWPLAIAPYHVHILALQSNVDEVMDCGETLYQQCKQAGIEVLFDDRSTRAGGKFKDADLIGIPLRVSIGGRGLKEGCVEFKNRKISDDVHKVKVDEIFDLIQKELITLSN